MSEQLTAILKRKLDELTSYGNVDAQTRRNVLKEELQIYVLNFLYQHAEYSAWIMYGGSALRIIHGLDRMSVDLDFEIPTEPTEQFLENLKSEIENHFTHQYGVAADFLSIKITGRGLLLKFHLTEELSFGYPSRQLHVKIDLNHFIAPKTVTERRPINRDQLSFVIATYNMGALMASKIAAIFQRPTRGVGKIRYEEKGRDIYDLLWYMNKKAVPDLDYLKAKNVEQAKDLRTLFDKLTIKMNSVSDENLKQDLSPLFIHKSFIENWLQNWRESYVALLRDYKIRIVTTLLESTTEKNMPDGLRYFNYFYSTEDGSSAVISYVLSERGIKFKESDVAKYSKIFYKKTEAYLKKTNRTILGDSIVTKIIRITADNLDQKKEILLNKSTLLSCALDDLLL